MTPVDALIELLGRVRAVGNAFVAECELNQWPPGALSAMKSQGLLAKASPATSAICPGCEQDCTMPVETIPNSAGAQALFVVCDKRSDTNRVAISADHLVQWQASALGVAKFVAQNLSVRWQGTSAIEGNTLEIGIMKCEKKSQMLCLRSERELVLVAGSSHLPLAEVIEFAEGRYALDVQAVEQLVNTSTTPDARYTPSNAKREARKLDTKARYERWQKEYRRRKKAHPDGSDTWCAIQISKMEIGVGKSVETIRKNMK